MRSPRSSPAARLPAPARTDSVGAMKPSIGRVLHYHYLSGHEAEGQEFTTAMAHVVDVHSDTCVTLDVRFSPFKPPSDGQGSSRTSVLLSDKPELGECSWPIIEGTGGAKVPPKKSEG